jgi:site-specific DNA recombinase
MRNKDREEEESMRVASYIRVSSEEQLEGHSLEAQRHSIQAFVESRQWRLVQEYCDAGVSAKRDSERPALAQLRADAAQDRFDVVVVDKVDRFFRHLKGLLVTLNELAAQGVSFVSVRENLDFSTPWGKLALTVLGMLAEIYIDNLREETRKGKRARARKGLWNGSIPLGYCNGRCSSCSDPNGPGYCPHVGEADRSDGQRLIAHPIEQVAVQLAYRWYVGGRASDGDIAERLNAYEHRRADGQIVRLRTKGLPGRYPPGPFTKDSVRELLQRRFYTGVTVYYGRDHRGRKRKRDEIVAVYPGQHPALIDEATFERAVELRRQVGRRTRDQTRRSRIYPLSGLLHCADCLRRMRAISSNGGIRYYQCSGRIQHLGCRQPMVRAERIEAQVLAFLQTFQVSDERLEAITAELYPPGSQEQLAEEEARLRARLARASELYLAGDISRERYREEKWACREALTNLRPVEISAIIDAVPHLTNVVREWETASPRQKNRLLRTVVAAAFVHGDTLVACQATELCYPLMYRLYCHSGSDGNGVLRK